MSGKLKKLTIWLVACPDGHLNQVFTDQLGLSDESRHEQMSCANTHNREEKLNVWECPLFAVKQLIANKHLLQHCVRVFSWQGQSGRPKECTFLFDKKSRLPKKHRKKPLQRQATSAP